MSQSLGSGADGGRQAYGTDQSVRVEILPDTALSVGASFASADDKWMRSVSAEQKLFKGPVSVTGLTKVKALAATLTRASRLASRGLGERRFVVRREFHS